jgi:hypothetical protein
MELAQRSSVGTGTATLVAGFLAVAELERGSADRCWPLFAWACREAARHEQPRTVRTLAVLEQLLRYRARMRPAGTFDPDGRDRHPFLEERLAAALAGRLAESQPGVALRVGPACSWLELPDGDRIDLSRRPVLHRLAHVLVEARRRRPGVAVTSQDLIGKVWPDDKSKKSAMDNRLWVAISTLRKLGLGGVLRRDAEGYLLDPDLELTEVEGVGS